MYPPAGKTLSTCLFFQYSKSMRCDVCGSGDSVFFIKPDGSGGELRMCRSCAVSRGHASDGEGSSARLDSLPGVDSGSGSGSVSGACASCGWTAALLRTSGRLGCPACVHVFRRDLMSALKRTGRAGPYEGKIPRRCPTSPEDPLPAALSAALEQAIQNEDFETAATLRDRIRAGSGDSAP